MKPKLESENQGTEGNKMMQLNLLKMMAEVAAERLKSNDHEEIHAMLRTLDNLESGAKFIKDKPDTTAEEKKVCNDIIASVASTKEKIKNN